MAYKFIDLFCGIGGFHQAAQASGGRCVFASDIDIEAKRAYEANYNITPYGDITQINTSEIPEHDILFAGFPCQPFSIIGKKLGFDDIRGTLFFEIARILKVKKPKMFILENVKQLYTHNKGETLKIIIETLEKLGYKVYKNGKAVSDIITDFTLPIAVFVRLTEDSVPKEESRALAISVIRADVTVLDQLLL